MPWRRIFGLPQPRGPPQPTAIQDAQDDMDIEMFLRKVELARALDEMPRLEGPRRRERGVGGMWTAVCGMWEAGKAWMRRADVEVGEGEEDRRTEAYY